MGRSAKYQREDAGAVPILFVTSMLIEMGGAERNLCQIVRNLDRHRWSCHVWTFHGGGRIAEELKEAGIPLTSRMFKKILDRKTFREALVLARYIKENRIRIVLTYHADADIFAGLVARLCGVPILISSRRDMGYSLDKNHILFYRMMSFMYSSFIAVSNAVKERMVSRDRIRNTSIRVIHNGINMSEYCLGGGSDIRKSYGVEATDILIGVVGSFQQIKNQMIVVEAVNRIAASIVNLKVIFVGWNMNAYYRQVSDRIDQIGYRDRFLMAGHQVDVKPYLQSFDIFILPSLSEGFSNAMIEAMASGLGIIASRVAGNLEAIEDGRNGLLFDPGDSQSLAEKIRELAGDPSRRRSLGECAREDARKRFSQKKMIGEVEDEFTFQLFRKKFVDRINIRAQRNIEYHVKKRGKIIVSSVLNHAGALKRIRSLERHRLDILAFHSINRPTIRTLEIEQDPEIFSDQIKYIRNNYNVISIDDYISCIEDNIIPPRNSVLLTFDDGYKDFATFAYPVLKTYNVPAINFVTTDAIDRKAVLLFDVLRFSLQVTSRRTLNLTDYSLKIYDIWKDDSNLSAIIGQIVRYSKKISAAKRTSLIRDILDRLDIEAEVLMKLDLYLSWDDIREFSRNGIAFGCHTRSHISMNSYYSRDDMVEEVMSAKEIIERNIRKTVDAFAFPYGGKNDYCELSVEIVKECGFRCAFVLGERERRGFMNGRKTVDSHMACGADGKFSPSLFNYSLIYN